MVADSSRRNAGGGLVNPGHFIGVHEDRTGVPVRLAPWDETTNVGLHFYMKHDTAPAATRFTAGPVISAAGGLGDGRWVQQL